MDIQTRFSAYFCADSTILKSESLSDIFDRGEKPLGIPKYFYVSFIGIKIERSSKLSDRCKFLFWCPKLISLVTTKVPLGGLFRWNYRDTLVVTSDRVVLFIRVLTSFSFSLYSVSETPIGKYIDKT